ncbi:MAG: ABC transporter substrate-binding protein [Legionellales bacterium]|jgi:ABC-type amino acid transport substrate-binding protein
MKKYLLLLCALMPFSLLADEIVKRKIMVSGYVWPPFVELNGREYQGLTLDLIDAANAVQGDFIFEFILTTPDNRHKDFYQKKFDMMFFEDIDWDWLAYPVSASTPLIKGTELFIALDKTGRTETFFQELNKKSLSAVAGMHYSFAGQNSDEKYLKEHFNIRLMPTPADVLQDVLQDKAEIGVINSISLEQAFLQDPGLKKKILISKKIDQDFVLSILNRNNSAMSIEQVNLMIDRLKKEGILDKLWEKYNIKPNVK